MIARVVILILIGALTAVPALSQVITVPHEGLDRKARVHNAGDVPRPLIVFLHGYKSEDRAKEVLDTELASLMWAPLNDQATEHGFAVAYPFARGGEWAITPNYKRARHPETGYLVDDRGFINELVGRLVADGTADAERIYLVGWSDGAIFSFYFLCRPDHVFAGGISLIGSMQETVAQTCSPKPVRFMAVAGTNDRILPYDGWMFTPDRELSVPQTLHHFALAHGCTRQRWRELPDRVKEDNSRLRLVWWRECDAPDGIVRLLRVEGGGHTVPHPDPLSPEWVKRAGGHNRDIDTAEMIWGFFDGKAELPQKTDPGK